MQLLQICVELVDLTYVFIEVLMSSSDSSVKWLSEFRHPMFSRLPVSMSLRSDAANFSKKATASFVKKL